MTKKVIYVSCEWTTLYYVERASTKVGPSAHCSPNALKLNINNSNPTVAIKNSIGS